MGWQSCDSRGEPAPNPPVFTAIVLASESDLSSNRYHLTITALQSTSSLMFLGPCSLPTGGPEVHRNAAGPLTWIVTEGENL